MSLERYQPKNNVSQLDNRPKLTADNLKKEFDKAENNIGEFINNKLIPSIETEFDEVNEQIEGKADTATLENQIGEVTELVDKKYTELDKKSIQIVTITGLEVTTPGGNGGVVQEGYATSSMTANEIYEAYSVGKTIIAQIPSLSTAAIVCEVSERQCKFTAMSGDYNLDEYTFIISDNEDIGTECRYERCTMQTYIFDSLDMDSIDYALSANQGRILNEKINQLHTEISSNSDEISNLSANKIKDDSGKKSPEGTVGATLHEVSRRFDGIDQSLGECERTWNKTYEIDSDSTDDTYPSAKAVWDGLNGKLSVEMVFNPDDCYSVGISRLYYVINMQNEEKGNYYLLSYAENHPEFVTTYPPSENEYTLNVIQYKFAGGDVKKRVGKLFYKEYDGEHTYLNREWSKWSRYVTDAVLEEKIGDIDSALEHIIEIQEQLMGVSE